MKFSLTLVQIAGLLGVVAIIALSLVPGADRPHTGMPGKTEHFIAYCFTASALAFGFRTRVSWLAIALGLAVLAGSMEILQFWAPGRHPAISDAVFSCLGALLGVLLGGVVLFRLAAQMRLIAP